MILTLAPTAWNNVISPRRVIQKNIFVENFANVDEWTRQYRGSRLGGPLLQFSDFLLLCESCISRAGKIGATLAGAVFTALAATPSTSLQFCKS